MINTTTEQKFRNLIGEHGFENSQFSIEKQQGAISKSVKISYYKFSYYFIFAERWKDEKLNCHWTPDEIRNEGRTEGRTLEEILSTEFPKWLGYLKSNLQAGGEII